MSKIYLQTKSKAIQLSGNLTVGTGGNFTSNATAIRANGIVQVSKASAASSTISVASSAQFNDSITLTGSASAQSNPNNAAFVARSVAATNLSTAPNSNWYFNVLDKYSSSALPSMSTLTIEGPPQMASGNAWALQTLSGNVFLGGNLEVQGNSMIYMGNSVRRNILTLCRITDSNFQETNNMDDSTNRIWSIGVASRTFLLNVPGGGFRFFEFRNGANSCASIINPGTIIPTARGAHRKTTIISVDGGGFTVSPQVANSLTDQTMFVKTYTPADSSTPYSLLVQFNGPYIIGGAGTDGIFCRLICGTWNSATNSYVFPKGFLASAYPNVEGVTYQMFQDGSKGANTRSGALFPFYGWIENVVGTIQIGLRFYTPATSEPPYLFNANDTVYFWNLSKTFYTVHEFTH